MVHPFSTTLIEKSYIGNILRIGRNESQSSYLPDTKTESKGETEEDQEAAAPWGGAACPLAAPACGLGPSALLGHRPSAYKFPSSQKL
jgi:hypothetical protein